MKNPLRRICLAATLLPLAAVSPAFAALKPWRSTDAQGWQSHTIADVPIHTGDEIAVEVRSEGGERVRIAYVQLNTRESAVKRQVPSGPATAPARWWMDQPIRLLQTNLRETDSTLDPPLAGLGRFCLTHRTGACIHVS